jgi:UDP-glucuronate decarboxylase
MINDEINEIIKNLGDISFANKNVLITGGAGFLGSWICDVLIQQNARVICVDNLSSGLKENIKNLLNNSHFWFIEQDVSVPLIIREKVDIILHLASRASPFEFDKFPIEILKANSLGTLNALELAKKNNARLLFASTSEVYGDATIIPTPESYQGNVNSVGIRGCYDEAKRVGEAYCMAFFRQYGIDVRIARIFNTYGPRMRADGHYGRVIPRFISQAIQGKPITIFGDGSQTRSFCYVTDQVEGLLRFAIKDGIDGEVINLGMPNEITIFELAETVKKVTNSDTNITFHELPPDDPKRRSPAIEKAERIIDWKPKISLSDGLIRTTKAYG